VGGSHFLFEAVEVAFAHVAGGELTLSWPWTHPFISASCRYDRQLNAGIDGRVAAPYDSRDGSFLTLLDLSQAKVELKAELPAPHGGTFSCPVYSLDGETFAIAESSESGSVLYIGDFTGELTEVFTSEQPSMQTYARN
jgi:hypothetical protein